MTARPHRGGGKSRERAVSRQKHRQRRQPQHAAHAQSAHHAQQKTAQQSDVQARHAHHMRHAQRFERLALLLAQPVALAQQQRHGHARFLAHDTLQRAGEGLAHAVGHVPDGRVRLAVEHRDPLIGGDAEGLAALAHPQGEIHVRLTGFAIRQIHAPLEADLRAVEQHGRDVSVMQRAIGHARSGRTIQRYIAQHEGHALVRALARTAVDISGDLIGAGIRLGREIGGLKAKRTQREKAERERNPRARAQPAQEPSHQKGQPCETPEPEPARQPQGRQTACQKRKRDYKQYAVALRNRRELQAISDAAHDVTSVQGRAFPAGIPRAR